MEGEIGNSLVVRGVPAHAVGQPPLATLGAVTTSQPRTRAASSPAPRTRRRGRERPPRTARSVLATIGRVLLGIVVTVLLAGAFLAILAFYADLRFDVEEVVVALLVSGVIVFLWTRWR